MLDKDTLTKLRDEYEETWRASDDLLNVLSDLMALYKPRRILETGPGISTFVVLSHIQHNPDAFYFGVDHKGDFSNRHLERLARFTANMLCYEETQVFDLARSDGFYEFVTEGGTNRFQLTPPDMKFDLMIIDGPDSGEARSSARAWNFYKSVASKDAIWIIDDTHRQHEQMLVEMVRCVWTRNESQNYRIFDSKFKHRCSTIIIPDRIFMFTDLGDNNDKESN